MLKFIFLIMALWSFSNSFKMTTLMLCSILLMWLLIYPFHSFSLLGFSWACDSISAFLVLLTFFIFLLMYLSSHQIWEQNDSKYYYHFILVLLLLLLVLTFINLNLLIFFIWFEAILIPMVILILGWGAQMERLNAGLYLLFYTLFGSVPLLLALIYWQKTGSLDLLLAEKNHFSLSSFWFLALLTAFLIKLPLYGCHYWLPKAHVEAPVTGSMLLAGILLKLGVYGLYRLYLTLSKHSIDPYLISLSLWGGIWTSLYCLRQTDVKSLVAYSSIGHMGLLLAGFLTHQNLGFQGGIWMMIAHGLAASGLFCLMNLYYERSHSRNLLILRGFLTISPSLVFWTFLLVSSNMAAPPSLNLISELHLFSSLYFYHPSLILLLFFLFMSTGAYSLFLYSSLTQGPPFIIKSLINLNVREQLILWLHWFPLNTLLLTLSEI